MFFSSFLIVGLISARINAIPLNINLGAYSPALVVGDGEISFRGKEEVSELMDALEGAAVSGAAKNGASGDATNVDAGEGLGVPQNTVIPGAPLQGMGKIITPRITNLAKRDEKRDINGFNAALSFASDSLSKGPAVELSTGPKGSGVGVRVNPKNAQAKGNAAQVVAPSSPPPAARPRPQNGLGRREEIRVNESPKTETTVTTMLVRGVSKSESEDENESLDRRSAPTTEDVDSVNLNVADGQLAELTFVETRSVNESDKETQ